MKYLLLLACAAFAQSISMNNMETPKTELFYSKENPAQGDTLYFKVTIPQGWHINANRVLDDFLIPSSIEPVANGIKLDSAIWPEPFRQYNEVLKSELLLLQDIFTIKIPIISVAKNSNPYNLKLKFTYQACSNICLPPKTIEVSFDGFFESSNTTTEKKNSELLIYFLLAMLGGLLLNAMPCVLPVLFLKVFDLMQKSGESRKNLLKWGFATTGGVLFSFLAIAALISSIRLTGQAVGWGFQFQHPAYTAAMALGLAVFALSLLGMFDIWMPGNVLKIWEKQSKAGGYRGAFAYGILLVLLSTPCSAPFLGTAVAFAFTASIAELFVIFIAIALGLSAPYLILSIFPQWTKKLPRPGPWMETVKRFLALPLFLTVVWLVWVFYRQAGAEASIRLCTFLLLAVFFAWLSGTYAKPGKPWARFCFLWLAFALLFAFLWNLWIKPQSYDMDFTVQDGVKSDWSIFSASKLDSLQSEGFAVWVNGTADWCITCKVNEKKVFENEKVKKAFAENSIIKMQADYTKPNYEALKFFEKHGRGGVPFDLLLTAYGEAILLPELLTVDAVIEALKRAY
jgi:thiol:disulfide interchange protein DsbD